jgi:LPS-assembly protein
LVRGAIIAVLFVAAGASTTVGQAPSPSPTPSSTPSPEGSPSPSISPSPDVSPSPAISPSPAASPTPTPAPTPVPLPSATPAPALETGNIRVKADQQGHEEGHSWFRGSCDMQFGEVRINGDAFDFYIKEMPDGTEQRRLVAEGNVVFIQGEERLAGTKLDMDLNTGKGTFDHPFGYVAPGLFVEGKTLERLDPKTYKVDDPRFTSCNQPNPRWSFSASSAKIRVGDKITAFNTWFKVKSVPTPVYFPYFAYPIGRDGRGSGLLFPKFGFGADKGFELGLGYFWAMGRSYDQTFLFDNYSKIGYGMGHEFRYIASPTSRGTFNTYLFKQTQPYLGRDPDPDRTFEYDIEANAQQGLPGRFRLSFRTREYSSLGFQQRFQESILYAAQRSKSSSITLAKPFGAANFSLTADRSETFYGENRSAIRRHLPTARLRQGNMKLGKTGILFGYDLRGDGLHLGNVTSIDGTVRVDDYSRYDGSTDLARPTSLTFLQLTPRARYRRTRYGARLEQRFFDDGVTPRPNVFPEGPAVDRNYYELSLEARGPNVSRVMGGIGSYTDKIKHVIGPEITYLFRQGDNIPFDVIPKFDGDDYVVGTNQVTYGIYQSFLAKRPSSTTGKSVPYEFLSWRILQTYYGDVSQNPASVDPNFDSSFEQPPADAEKIRTSPIKSIFRFRPLQAFNTDFTVEYDPNFSAFKSIRLSTGLSTSRLSLDVGYYKSVNLAKREANVGGASGVTGVYRSGTARASFQIIPTRLIFDTRVDYDFEQKRLFNAIANLKYNVQCCSIGAQAFQKGVIADQGKESWGFKIQIELANIGGLGNSADRGGSLTGRRY